MFIDSKQLNALLRKEAGYDQYGGTKPDVTFVDGDGAPVLRQKEGKPKGSKSGVLVGRDWVRQHIQRIIDEDLERIMR